MNDSGWIEEDAVCRRTIGPYVLRSCADGEWTLLILTRGPFLEYETATVLKGGSVVLEHSDDPFTLALTTMETVTRAFRKHLSDCLEVVDAP